MHVLMLLNDILGLAYFCDHFWNPFGFHMHLYHHSSEFYTFVIIIDLEVDITQVLCNMMVMDLCFSCISSTLSCCLGVVLRVDYHLFHV